MYTAILCFCHLYVQGGIGYQIQRGQPDAVNRHYLYDRTRTANPLGSLQIGYELPLSPSFRVDFNARHESFPSVGDMGEDTLWVQVRWSPFK